MKHGFKCEFSPKPDRSSSFELLAVQVLGQVASFPGLHTQLFSLAVRKAWEGLDRYITWCVLRLMSCSVCSLLGLFSPPSLFSPWIQFILSVQFVLRVRLLLDRSWLATVCDVSRGTLHVINPSRPSPAFCTVFFQVLATSGCKSENCAIQSNCRRI